MSNITITDVFRDILKHTHGLGIYEKIKLDHEAEPVVEAMNDSKDVILKATLNEPLEQFANSTVGLARLAVLDGYFKYEGFSASNDVEVVKTEAGAPTELKFLDAAGTDAHYRFMKAEVINQQSAPVKVNEPPNYDVVVSPSLRNLKDLSYFNGILGAFESTFVPHTENGQLFFYLGDNGGDRTKILISESTTGSITSRMKWQLDVVLKIIKIGLDGGEVTLNFHHQGLLKITVVSSIGTYNYYLPAIS